MEVSFEPRSYKLSSDWSSCTSVIPFGYGINSLKILDGLLKDFDIPFIVDSNQTKWAETYKGIPVVSYEKIFETAHECKILITTNKKYYSEIAHILSLRGLKEYKDYCCADLFIKEFYPRFRSLYNLSNLQIALTTNCTLNCLHCNMFIPWHKKRMHYSISDFKIDMDTLFKKTDYIFSLTFVGGEPMINPDFDKIIEYVNKTYSNQFGRIVVITNGMQQPKLSTVKLLYKYNVLVVVSDYSNSVGNRGKIKETLNCLSDNKIQFVFRKDIIWKDFGFPLNSWNLSNDEAYLHMLCCDPEWRGYNDGKLYFCHIAWSAERAGLVKLKKEDCLELALLENNQESKKCVWEYAYGMKQNYFSFCKICGGCGEDNPAFVPAGEQA